MEYANPMQHPRIEKAVVNIGVGESGEKLGKAEKLIETLTSKTPVRTVSKHKIPGWGIKKGEPIGCKITLRGKQAEEVIKRFLYAKDNNLKKNCFGKDGNLSFGVREYIDIEGLKYDPDIGIFGMNLTVTLERPGYRIKRRRIDKKKIPDQQRISQQESIDFFKDKFGVNIEE